ncbi:uncharacterized protein LOC107459589 [Arachis duranensis]|uniref:Uncharacterized protein LOC107459589 n=1 Tax=Arachis duranensis TaxID=130453 RepID=A0A6P4B758_ARADU|nr:uncharacterized protein LOC107459589 [Arachis duranensis]
MTLTRGEPSSPEAESSAILLPSLPLWLFGSATTCFSTSNYLRQCNCISSSLVSGSLLLFFSPSPPVQQHVVQQLEKREAQVIEEEQQQATVVAPREKKEPPATVLAESVETETEQALVVITDKNRGNGTTADISS